MGKLSKIAHYSLALLVVTGCTSKFEDRDPDSQSSSNGFTVEHNMKANEDLDRKMQRLEENSEKIRKVIKLVKQFNDNHSETYTQFDLILDVNDQLAESPSRAEGSKFVRDGHYKLNVKGLSPECSEIDTRIETMSQGGTVVTGVDDVGNSIDGLIYSVRTCHSQGEFVEIANVVFTSYDVSVNFNNDNIRKTLTDIFAPVVQVNSNCQLTVDARSVLQRAQCSNLISKISDTEKAEIENVVYDRTADFPFALEGKVWGPEKPKAEFGLKIDQNFKLYPKFVDLR